MFTAKRGIKIVSLSYKLDDVYDSVRSQLLMSNPLPSVEVACVAIQQEKNQLELLNMCENDDISPMISQGSTCQCEQVVICNMWHKKGYTVVICNVWHKEGDTVHKCWHKIRFPECYNKNAKKN